MGSQNVELHAPSGTNDSHEKHDFSLDDLKSLIASERSDILAVLLYGASVGFFSLVVPIAAQSLVNTVSFNTLLQPILVLTSIVLLMLGVASVLRIIQTVIVELIQQRIFARVAMDLAYRLPRVKMQVFDHERGTELVNRFFEVMTVQKSAALMLLDGLATVLQSVIGLVLLAFYHPILLAFDALLILAILGVVLIPYRRGISTSITESKAKYKVAAWLKEIAANPLVFKFFHGSEHALAKTNEATQEYLVARKAHFKTLIRQISGTLLVQTLVSGLLLGLGSVLVIKGELTLGQLVAAEIIVTTVVSGFAKFGKYFESFYDLAAAVDKIGHLFSLPLEKEVEENNSTIHRQKAFTVQLKKVSFSYGSSFSPILSEVHLELQALAKIGIEGASGSGKSTLLDLILGFRAPADGVIEVGGVDLREVRLEELRKEIALVGRVEVFAGSLLENIRVGRNSIPIEECRAVLSKVGLLEEVSALPDGLLTDLSGTLCPLSAGQLQRLMLARAIIGKPKLLLLDEPFENIDTSTKEKIMKVLFAADAPWTLILTSHEPTELSHCDSVFSLKEGRLTKVSRSGRGTL